MNTTSERHAGRRRAAATLLVAAVLALGAVPAQITRPSSAAEHDELRVSPAVQRTEDDATVAVELGALAPDDAWVTASLHAVAVDEQGRITSVAEPLDRAAARIVTNPTRLRPGERALLRVTASEPGAYAVRINAAAGGSPAGAAEVAEAVLLVGPPPADPPTVRLLERGEQLEVLLAAASPTLVNVELTGETRSLATDRLVLGPELRFTVDRPAFPRTARVAVTDELGRTVTAATGTLGLRLLAGLLVLAATAAVTAAARRERRVTPPAATTGASPSA